MRTKKLEKIAVCVLVVLCVAVAALALKQPASRTDAPDPRADTPPTEPAPSPAPQTDGTPAVPQSGAPDVQEPPAVSSGQQAVQADAPKPEGSGAPAALAPEKQEAAPQTSGGDGLISAEEAQAAALAHAGLTAGEVTFTQQKLEWEDGRQVYDVEFYTGGREYDYEIDAATGEVVKFDYDAESYTPPVQTGDSITEERAREIALAEVPGAAAEHVRKLKLDHDDGRTVYEVEIIYNEMEYDLEISAADGAILEFEAESVYD